jgi:hypothetical protein
MAGPATGDRVDEARAPALEVGDERLCRVSPRLSDAVV